MINGQVSHWWEQIGLPVAHPTLNESLEVDVAIVGAGFTGLWTAYYLKQADPSLRIAILEQRHVGYGASGRNGGWLTNTITGGREQYLKSHGRQAATDFQLAMNQTVAEVIRICQSEQIEADILPGGEFEVACNAAQLARLREFVKNENSWEHTDVQLLTQDDAIARIGVEGALGAAWHPHAARIQPAKLVNGLTRVVQSLGVEIYEYTRVTEIRPHQLDFAGGQVAAEFIIRATEGFTAGIKGHKRLWLPMNSSMIATEPLETSFWDEVNWSQGEVLGDFAHVYMYAQRTADDRIAIGGRGVPYKYGSRTDLDGQTPEASIKGLQEILHTLFPQTRHTSIDHAWSGVLGVPRDWAATVGLDSDSGIAWAGGYVGTGVATTNLAGRTLRDLVLGRNSDLVALPWVNHQARLWEPEPLRWIATKGLYAAYGLADRQEAKGSSHTSPIAHIADLVTGKR
ncbi:NAD(P)/FAD-dependent oxidoreductase [Glutamicibacter sp.]|uniref:NAD(P)/FAD-dependent oxidoreductase n=1 Tax=Glutamicibacter sp. TaxID=1931995 RepID=UPI002B46D686|nr:FAD-binding oxidoreductase [Glutamicibacter sp.]HJX78753.1 FAD-binding oxidoreductase [Glutamicibacter sp.]